MHLGPGVACLTAEPETRLKTTAQGTASEAPALIAAAREHLASGRAWRDLNQHILQICDKVLPVPPRSNKEAPAPQGGGAGAKGEVCVVVNIEPVNQY